MTPAPGAYAWTRRPAEARSRLMTSPPRCLACCTTSARRIVCSTSTAEISRSTKRSKLRCRAEPVSRVARLGHRTMTRASPNPQLVDQQAPERVELVVAHALRDEVRGVGSHQRHGHGAIDELAIDLRPERVGTP